MLVAAALCPAAPLLARELTGADPVVPELRQACLDATAFLLTAGPGLIAVVGVAAQARAWPADSMLDLGAFAPPLRQMAGRAQADRAVAAGLPAALGLGAMLLDQAGYGGQRVLRSVTQDASAADCAALGAALAGARERVALLVMADGSARRTLRAPGYLDERSASLDAEAERAIASGDLQALLAIDAGLARELMATGRPAWQVLAGAARGVGTAARVRYRDDPFGVFYLVVSLACDPQATGERAWTGAAASPGRSAAAFHAPVAGCDTQADVVTCRFGHASWTV